MTLTTFLVAGAVLVVAWWSSLAVGRVPHGRWVVATRGGVVRRGRSCGLVWRWPGFERFESGSEQPHEMPVGVRATTRDGVPVLVLLEATVSIARPAAGTTYVAPWPAAELAAERTIARSVTGWSAVELTQTADDARGPLRLAVRSAVDELGVEVHDLALVEVDVRLDDASRGPG